MLGIGDIILTEVLQGFRTDKDYRTAKRMLTLIGSNAKNLFFLGSDRFWLKLTQWYSSHNQQQKLSLHSLSLWAIAR
ncbi:MAG: hypothetical protein WBM86_26825 [Waterburya sp.]